jgi:hypothetical protein
VRLDQAQLPRPLQLSALTNRELRLESPWKRFIYLSQRPAAAGSAPGAPPAVPSAAAPATPGSTPAIAEKREAQPGAAR